MTDVAHGAVLVGRSRRGPPIVYSEPLDPDACVATHATGPITRAGPRCSPACSRLDERRLPAVATRWPHPRWFTLPSERALAHGQLRHPLVRARGSPLAVRRRRTACARFLYVAAPVFATEIITFLLKALVGRRRPSLDEPRTPAPDPPADAATRSPRRTPAWAWSACSPWAASTPRGSRPWRRWSRLLAFSRVYLAVHYLGDVLAGLVLGTILGVLFGIPLTCARVSRRLVVVPLERLRTGDARQAGRRP